jgi:gliding motility-associated-like protein
MKRIYFLTVVFIAIVFTTASAQSAGLCCPYTGWSYIQPITVTNNTGAALPAQPTLFVINTATPIGAGKMQANGNDIRFVYNTCGNYLNYWIESGINTASTQIWVALPAIPSGATLNLYLYYGNASAPAGASPQATLFPNIQTITGAQTLSGTIAADWIHVNGATINAPAGQPLVLRARRIIFAGTYNADFRGYGPQAGPGAGTNGGGSRGGSGGSYGGVGGSGGGGTSSPYGTANGTDIDMGSGGGGSDCNASAAGGGAISLIGSSIDVNGTINVRGQSAQSCCCNNNSEAAGGGSGGGVLVRGDYLRGNGTINANGGNGGDSDDKEGGGGGSGGRVKLIWCRNNAFSGTVTVAGGAPGSGNQNGMQPGAAGTNTQPQSNSCVAITISPEQPVSLPVASFSYFNACTGVLAGFSSNSTVAPAGSISSYAWNFGDGGTATTPTTTHTYPTPGNYNAVLTVTSVTGCTDDTTIAINVQQLPVADFTATTVCAGNATTFTDASNGGIAGYNWNFGDGNTAISQSPTHTYLAGGTYNVTLIVTNSGNCADTIQKQVTVNDGPVASLSAPDVCFPATVVFDNSATSGTVSTIGWSFGDGQFSTQQIVTHDYAAPGTYNVVMVVSSSNGCADTATITVTVYDKPAAAFTVAAVCEGTASSFNNTSTGTGITYAWDFGDGVTDPGTSPTHLYATAGSYTATLVVTNPDGCSDTAQQQALVNGMPVAAFTAPDACSNNTVQFTNTSTGTTGTCDYNFDDGLQSSLCSPAHIYTTAGTYNVTLTVTTAAGCTDSYTDAVVINPVPVADFTVAPVCEGLASVFNNTSSIGSGSITGYGWSFGDGNLSTQQSPANTYTTYGNYNVTLVVQSDNGCYDTATKQAVVNPLPQVDFTTGAVCLNQNNTFANTTTIGSGSVAAWAWDFGDTQTSAQQSPAHVYATQGTYTVSLVAVSDNNCADSTSKQVNVYDKPVAAFSASEVCEGQPTVFTDGSTIGTGTITQWSYDYGDNQTGNTASGNHTYAAAGSYTGILVVTSNNNCTDTAQQTVTVNPLPVVNFTAPDVCLGTPTNFTNQTTIASGSIASQSWDAGDGSIYTDVSFVHTYAAVGTYTITLTAISDKGCQAGITGNTEVYDLPVASATATPACYSIANGSATVTVTGGAPAYTYSWSSGNNTANATNLYAGTYTVTVTDTHNCTGTAQAAVTEPATALVVTATPPAPAIVIGESIAITLSNSYNDANAVYSISPAYGLSCTDCAQPEASPYQSTDYFVQVTDANGCTGTGEFTVKVDQAIPVFVPNVFTPNSDGANDTWGVFSKSVKQMNVAVFNRWGEKVFETNSLSDTWNGEYQGKPAPAGIYTYTGYIVYLNDANRQVKGTLTLMR